MFQNITVPTKYLSLNVNSINKGAVICDKSYIYLLTLIFHVNICFFNHLISFLYHLHYTPLELYKQLRNIFDLQFVVSIFLYYLCLVL